MLHQYTIQQLDNLIKILDQIDDDAYTQCMEDVFESTIGRHTRHIIEFYQAFYKGYSKGILNYDKRKRKAELEIEKDKAIKALKKLKKKLAKIPDEKDLILKLKIEDNSYFMPTTVAREFLYLMEHTTHHLALISIGLSHIRPDAVEIPKFGKAYSTPKL